MHTENMDNKTLVNNLASRMECKPQEINSLIESLGIVVKEKCSNMDSIAVPGFGTFEPKKKAERIAVHPSSGKRILIPPKISLVFKTSAVFKQKLRENQK